VVTSADRGATIDIEMPLPALEQSDIGPRDSDLVV
jgi:hypothetical protein